LERRAAVAGVEVVFPGRWRHGRRGEEVVGMKLLKWR
jgi:hypothetical protein